MPGAFAKTLSYGIFGVDAYQVQVEIDVMIGQEIKTIFQIVGLPEGAVRESRERVRSAIQNSGYWFPSARVTANLAPADIRKEGAAFDLALAIGVLAANGALRTDKLEDYALIGELGLDGQLRSVRGALPLALGCPQKRPQGPDPAPNECLRSSHCPGSGNPSGRLVGRRHPIFQWRFGHQSVS